MLLRLKYLPFIFFLFIACKNNKKSDAQGSVQSTITDSNYSYTVTYKGDKKVSEHLRNSDTLNHYYEIMQGLWQNADDEKNFYYIKGRHLYEILISEGKTDTFDGTFSLSYSSCLTDDLERTLDNLQNSMGSPKKQELLYMVRDEDLCYSVDSLTPTRLELTYPDPGRVFIFNKKQ